MVRFFGLVLVVVALSGCRWVAQDQALTMTLTRRGTVTVDVRGYQVGDRTVTAWTLPGGGAWASYGTDKSRLYEATEGIVDSTGERVLRALDIYYGARAGGMAPGDAAAVARSWMGLD